MGSHRAGGIRFFVGTALFVALGAGLVGCVPTKTVPVPTPPASTPTASATPTDAPIPTLNLQGTAKQNLAYFDKIGHALLDNNPSANASGETIVNYFVQAGFPKADMEVTPDKTSVGLAAWNIEFSVKLNGTCLIGQAGNVGFQSFVAPVVSTGTCLIGKTRPIDW